MSHTHRLKLPFIHSGQAQKEITHNEALNLLDVYIQTVARNIRQNEVPRDAELGELYIIGTAPKGEFKTHENEIAQKQEQGWRFITPFKWMRVTSGADGSTHRFNGKEWLPDGVTSYNIQPQPVTTTTTTTITPEAQQIQNDWLIKNENGEYLRVISLSEELEVKGAFTETAFKMPHHSIILAVNIRVIKPLQGAGTFSVGLDEDKSRYGSGLSSGKDTTNVGLTNHPLANWYDKAIRITADNGSFTGGTISVNAQLLKPHGGWMWD